MLVAIKMPSGFPQNTISTMRLLRVLKDELPEDKFTDATRHYWVGNLSVYPLDDFFVRYQ